MKHRKECITLKNRLIFIVMSLRNKFRIGDVVKYNGNVYRITNIISFGYYNTYIYDVVCLKNNFPDEPVCSSLGCGAESSMELYEFEDSGKNVIDKACEYLNLHLEMNHSECKKFIDDFRKAMEEN